MAKTTPDDFSTPNLHQFGNNDRRGNLLGIAPYMTAWDYSSSESFFKKLNNYLFVAQHEQWLNEKTIVVFPEYLGSWLVLAGEDEKIFQAATLETAEQKLALRHPLKYISHLFASHERGKTEAAFFRMKAKQMAEIYQDVFSRLANEYAVTIVAGSIVLPAPQISSGRLIPSDGPLYNSSIVYQPDGSPHPFVIRKVFPTSRELPFTTPASTENIPTFDTPAGRLGVLICADSWYPQAYVRLKEQDIDLLAVPSYEIFGMQYWNRVWVGYAGWPAPPDVDVDDVKRLKESEAWMKYALAGRIHSSGAKHGINVFLRGKLWDQDFGGWPATVVQGEEVFVEEQTEQAAMFNLWL